MRPSGRAGLGEPALAGGLLLGVVATALLVARNGLAPVQHPLTFGWVLGAYLTAACVGLALAAGVLALALARLLRRPEWARPLLAVATLAALAWALWRNARAARLAFDLSGPARFRWLLPAALLAACVALACLAWTAWRGGRAAFVARGVGLLALGGALLALAPPGLVDGARPAAVPAAPVAARARAGALPPVFVIGLDGADWRYADALMARGELPHLAELRRRGAWGPLATIQPTLSPAVWTTIATGRPPFRHGIQGFTTPRLRGVEDSLPGLHPLRGVGFDVLWRWLEGSGRVRPAPVTSRDRTLPAWWNLAESARAPVVVVHWWATWPAEPTLGFVVSDRAYAQGQQQGRDLPREHGLTFPPELYRGLAGDVMRYDQVTPDEARAFMDVPAAQFLEVLRDGRGHAADVVRELPYFLSLFESARRHALALVEQGRRTWSTTPDLMVIFRLIDQACHTSLGDSELVSEHPESSPERRRRFGRVVSEAYRRADRVVGELVAACGAGCNVIVLSDHGFELETFPGGLRRYHHAQAPPGLFVAAGPAFRPGRVEDLSVYDVLPLLAYLKGLPVARDLNGRLPEDVLALELRAAQPPRQVDTYGTRTQPADVASGTEAVDEEMLERLRALGYIQ